MLAHVRRRIIAFVLSSTMLATACSSDSPRSDGDVLALASAMAPVFVSDGPLPIDDQTAACLGDGIVEVVGFDELTAVGVTIEDPDGPADDVYAVLARDQLADVVVVWRACSDVPALVEAALLQSGPEARAAGVDDCIGLGLRAGLAERFLFDALADEAESGEAVTDVLRLVDGCTAGGSDPALATTEPGLWPWLSVEVPGYELTLLDADDPDAAALAAFLDDGGAQAEGVALAVMEITSLTTGEFAGALVAVAVEPGAAGGLSAASYAAGIEASAGDAEVFPITLPGGAEVLGWEEPDGQVITLVWPGDRVVVLATGPLVTADVLALYSQLVPAP